MKALALMLVVSAMVVGQGLNTRPLPASSFIVYCDSLRLDSTETKYLRAVWQEGYANKALLVECRDDSSAGFANDSAAAEVRVEQLFPLTRGSTDCFVTLASRANPDSTTKYGSSVFRLWDSLDIKSMDTACVYARNRVQNPITGGAGGFYPGDSLKTLQTTGHGAFAYTALPYDFSPAVAFKVRGCRSNKKGGVGSVWVFRVYALKGEVVKVAN
jgi:hypothetical protein